MPTHFCVGIVVFCLFWMLQREDFGAAERRGESFAVDMFIKKRYDYYNCFILIC